ncbi:TPA: 4-amino-4-deoxy-L-arabinose-phospho-UDP flippase [Pluralibacter gergoviae]|uniref:Probable 4-amino-4-deoxy-L-arabinose-phosphoundecaprenol flippase subunit ArnF n=1 Tax=Pluralibacter gergoviae TaxID=61647 RepID=A0A0J5L4N8_PLUGE|nr:4-amino-4-deoxy-L-arabinose-phosphoundecaprenol flippase subunit ArnF [Pluralibacter gergoviae]EKT9639870.1 4-amino-4-deoxy-L-arabinose-phospho-UDP flippase [Pluralibacter gergoviae]EKV0931124.1 4-amino-4-deoxy-L-arabinose-phospho-UDP flippase [Pluralibacter gergoviae]EKV3545571.1 4-amino-4-deoxy-L-arabinose-phospho-UDP flippase [Pluralibacter gergoviae]EKV6246304.1 4-amino-4-deoxy-L-arabinose-phospho-UDP flippase [Pluralibacter gergoviae]EKV9901043.1 4-amino-4-deoxy-L-arabinose-phospho-UDP
MGYLWALMSVLLVSSAQLGMKWAMVQLPAASDPDFATAMLAGGSGALALACGLAAYAFSIGCWYMALRRLPLSKVYPLLSLSYVLVWFAAMMLPWLNERFSPEKLIGVAAIVTGLVLICLPDKRRGK